MAATDSTKKNWPVVPWQITVEAGQGQPLTYFPLLHEVNFEPNQEQIMEIVFGRQWNIVRYRQGLAGLMWPCENGNVEIDPEEPGEQEELLEDIENEVDQDEIEEKRQ